MKLVLATAIATVAIASAQKYSTLIYTDCSPLPDKTITDYNTQTITSCSECEGGMTVGPGGSGGHKHTTVYTTEIYNFCPTGLSTSTVTITESCTEATPTWSPGHKGYVPQGYTTSEMTCSVCGETPITRFMTYPIGSPPAYPTSGPGGSGGAPATPTAAMPGSGACPGPDCRQPNGLPAPGSPGYGSQGSSASGSGAPGSPGTPGSISSPSPGSAAGGSPGPAQSPVPGYPGSPNRSPSPGSIIPGPVRNSSTIPGPSSGASSIRIPILSSLAVVMTGLLFHLFTIWNGI